MIDGFVFVRYCSALVLTVAFVVHSCLQELTGDFDHIKSSMYINFNFSYK